VPTPKPKDGELLIRMRASGVNNSDASNALFNRFGRKNPVIVGRDFAGEVVEAPGNQHLVGKRVAGSGAGSISITDNGAHAEYFVVPAVGTAVVPDGISDLAAASLGVPWTTAWLALERTDVRQRTGSDPELTVVVLGATGGVGRAAVQLARARGHRVLTTSRRDGTDINTTTDPKLSKVGELTDGKGADVYIDTVGVPELVTAALDALTIGGRYSFVAVKSKDPYPINFGQLYSRNQSIIGVVYFVFKAEQLGKVVKEVLDLAVAGKVEIGSDDSFQTVKFADATGVYEKVKLDGTKLVLVFN